MVYSPTNAKIVETAQLPKDSILDGIIISIEDGKVKDFIPEGIEWKGDKDGPAINILLEVKSGEEHPQIKQLFTYQEENGNTIVSSKSNLGKYKVKYGKLPEAGDQIKIVSNNDGFGKIKLD